VKRFDGKKRKFLFLISIPERPIFIPQQQKEEREREEKKEHIIIKRTGFGIVQRVAKSHLVPANREGVLARDGKHAAGEQRRRGDALEIRRGLGS